MADTLSAAQWLAGKGMHVFELDHPELSDCAGWHRPDDPCDGQRGKHPACKWSTAATTDLKAVIAMFTGYPRNIGVACGPSNLVVIDEDARGEFARFAESIGQTVPDTFKVKTGNGWHYYFWQPEGVKLSNQEGALRGYKVNVRGVGGYVVGPGSTHAAGVMYEPVDPEAAVLPCPAWLVQALNGKTDSERIDDYFTPPKDHTWWRDAEAIHHPKRHEAIVAAAGWCARVLTRDEAVPVIRDVWSRCAKNEGDPPKTYSWDQALAKLDDVYRRYDDGQKRSRKTEDEDEVAARTVRLTPAASIAARPVRWTWKDRVPVGELAITPGKGGIGKSTFHAWMIAHLTRGTLPGRYLAEPKPCVIAAAEDSWARTIVPRLIAAGADMTLVYRVDVVTETGAEITLSLPRDIEDLEAEITTSGTVLLSVDPLLSVIANGLDSHKDADVRRALEPLSRLADRTGVAVLGNAHFNKSAGNDPLSLVMGSAAFGNVARAALGFARDTEADDGSCVISQVKNNLGRLDLPSLKYHIVTEWIDTAEGPAEVGKLVMLGESDRSVADILRDRAGDGGDADAVAEWLRGLLVDGPVKATEVYRSADAAGYSKDQAKRAKKKLGVIASHPDITGPWWWELPQGSTKGAQGSGGQEHAPLAPLAAPLDEEQTLWKETDITEGTEESGHRESPRARGEMAICEICGRDMYLVEADQTTHPMCEETS